MYQKLMDILIDDVRFLFGTAMPIWIPKRVANGHNPLGAISELGATREDVWRIDAAA